MDKTAETKAFLIAEGGVDIDERILGRITTPASGPGAGLTSFFLRFDGHRVRLGIKHSSRLKASLEGDEVVIRDHEKEIVRGYLEDVDCPLPRTSVYHGKRSMHLRLPVLPRATPGGLGKRPRRC